MLQDNNTRTILIDKPWRLERCARERQNYIFEDLVYMTSQLEPGLWHLQRNRVGGTHLIIDQGYIFKNL